MEDLIKASPQAQSIIARWREKNAKDMQSLQKKKRLTDPEKLKLARLQLGLTQDEIAAKLGISPRFYLYRERGQFPSPKWLIQAVDNLVNNQ